MHFRDLHSLPRFWVLLEHQYCRAYRGRVLTLESSHRSLWDGHKIRDPRAIQ